MTALYVEFDPFAAAWLRELIKDGLIADGKVDSRDLRDIRPDELAGYRQVHLCAGIGIWSLALKQAGVPDDFPVWTASFPCQPFSAAGQRAGFADERHLWPSGFHLIGQCRPAIVLGEQVASPDGLRWLDLVSADMEGEGYAFGAADLCAAGACVDYADSEEGSAALEWIRRTVESCPDPVLAAGLRDFAALPRGTFGYGPAHIRQRLYWMADANPPRCGARWSGEKSTGGDTARIEPAGLCDVGGVADAVRDGARHSPGESVGAKATAHCENRDLSRQRLRSGVESSTCGLANANGGLSRDGDIQRSGEQRQQPEDCGFGRMADSNDSGPQGRSERGGGPGKRLAGPHRLVGADWIVCIDGKARSTQPGILPLADGRTLVNRMGTLRGAGNALHLETAVAFVKAAFGVENI